MPDRNPSPSPASSSSSVTVKNHCSRRRRHPVEADGGDTVSCNGKSCQSCTAAVIADCVAVCCCPCAVVNFLALVFLKLPYAVARKCITRRKRKTRQRTLKEKKKCCVVDGDGVSEVTSDNVAPSSSAVIGEKDLNESLSSEFTAEEVWLELYNVGHMGFGRVSFTGSPCRGKGN